MSQIAAQISEEQLEILESWERAAANHAERIRAEKADIAAHVDNTKTFGQQMTTNNPFVNTTNDIAETITGTITGCFGDSLN